MILDDDSLNVLRKWLIKHLEPLSDAEPYVLANYVLALLRNDKPRNELLEMCTSELEDFLKEETKQFVAKLFSALSDVENKRFDTLVPQDDQEHSINDNNNNNNNTTIEDEETERDHKHARRGTPPSTPPGRGRDEDDDRGHDDHKRRRDEDGSDEERRYDKRHRERQDDRGERHHEERGHDDRDRRPRRYDEYDKRGGPRQYGRGDGRRNVPYRNGQGNANQTQPGGAGGRPRQRCRDFEERGYCMNGDLCPYDHGAAPVVVTDVQELQKMKIMEPQAEGFQQEGYNPQQQQQKRQRFEGGENGQGYDQDMSSYNPDNGGFGYQQNFDRRRRVPPRNKLVGVPEDSIALQTIPLTPSTFQPHMGATTAAGDKRRIVMDPNAMETSEYKRPQPYDKQQRFHHNNNNNNDSNSIVLHPNINLNPNNPPHHLPSGHQHNTHSHGGQPNFANTTLLITNIPPDLNTIDQLNSHFKKFGNLVNIQVKSQANKSYVQFATHQEALRALRSVEAVLGNRFIKVFWSNTPTDALPNAPASSSPPNASAPSAPTPSSAPFTNSFNAHTGHSTHNRVFSPPSHAAPQPPFGDVKMEDKDKVKAMSTAPLARPPPSRTAESEKKEKLLELQKKKDELRKQQIAQQKQMLEVMTKKLKAGNLGQAERDELMKTMKASTDALQALLQKESSALLQKQQQQLEKQQQLAQQAQKPPAVAAPVAPVKDFKKKERLDRELDSIAKTPLTSSGDVTAPAAAATSSPTLSSPPLKTSGDAATLEHLQNLKKNLEQQAISMGLDPTALHKIPTTGGGRGRGRGGRGGVQDRGRGRGRGASMSLDNRPTSLILTDLPDDLANETALRGHFQTFGDVKVDFTSPAVAIVQFTDRFRAETALANGRQYKTQKLQVAWYNPAAQKPSLQDSKQTPSEADKEKVMDVSDDLSSSTASLQQDEPEAYGHFDEDEEDTERSWKH